jgi:TPR repeat protein
MRTRQALARRSRRPSHGGPGRARGRGCGLAAARKGCDAGQAADCRELGLLHENGRGVAKDVAAAALLYDKACRGGDVPACFYLATLYTFGLKGVFENAAREQAALDTAKAAGLRTASAALQPVHAVHPVPDTLRPCGQRACAPIQKDCENGHASACLPRARHEGRHGEARPVPAGVRRRSPAGL